MPKKFLKDVYSATDGSNVAEFYDRWADSYDAELQENSYATPRRLAEALVAAETPLDARILDFGCGTGLSGQAFVAHGYTLIDGTDLSAEMLAQAEAKQIYGRLWVTDPEAPLPGTPGVYDVIAAVGVVSPGAAPAALLAQLAGELEAGGRLAFSFNDHAMADGSYLDALRDLPDQGLEKLYESYGEHLPGIGLNSTVYVFERA